MEFCCGYVVPIRPDAAKSSVTRIWVPVNGLYGEHKVRKYKLIANHKTLITRR